VNAADLTAGVAHVWQFSLDDAAAARRMRPLLSVAERVRADRFYTEPLRMRYAVAHGWTRRILARYLEDDPAALGFSEGEFGKPALAGSRAGALHFNLSHSGDIGLVAVSADGPIGVDVERWDGETDHLQLAERFFSPHEREQLRALAADRATLVAGFFAAWTRKEAYLKATGCGITQGLHHFDVSLAPTAPPRLLADRLNPAATREWVMDAIGVGTGYSAAVVARAPFHRTVLLRAGVLDPNSQ
jgi:4'-phosphopantetheinyl transferase